MLCDFFLRLQKACMVPIGIAHSTVDVELRQGHSPDSFIISFVLLKS